MRHVITSFAAISIFATGVATAQMKAVPTSPNPAVQITPVNPAEQSLESARRITREEAIKMVREHKAVYVDVRGKDAYDAEHIKGAISIPLAELVTRIRELPRNQFVITYCAWTNEHTSARAVLDLNAHGIKNTAALLGGWNGWKEAQLPVEKTPPPKSAKKK